MGEIEYINCFESNNNYIIRKFKHIYWMPRSFLSNIKFIIKNLIAGQKDETANKHIFLY